MFAVVVGKFCKCCLPPHFAFQMEHLFFVIIRRRFLYRADGIAQIAVALFSILGDDGGRLGSDQSLFNQDIYIFF